jgi:molecular chaperone GrpE
MPVDSNGSNDPRAPEAIVDEGEATPARGATTEPSKDAATAAATGNATETPADPLAAAQAEAQRNKEGWLRTAADFDNFRKRTRKELEDMRKSGREDLLRALLPVFDNLERALQSAQRASDVKAVADGLTMVQRQFVDALGREGIQRVPTVGQAFDPSVHEAIQQVETADHAPGTVLAEVQPGYTQGERLVRAAMVVVAKGKSGDGGGPEKDPAS